jgi:quercetin dioxygenase-like cupin family protein/putative intracellular protease/amidase
LQNLALGLATPIVIVVGMMHVFLPLMVTAFSAPKSEVPPKVIGVLIFDKVISSDVLAPLEVFGSAVKEKELSEYRVVMVAPEKRPVTTEEGIVLMPHHAIDDAPKLDVLIVGSAYDNKPLLANEKLMRFIATRGREVSWLASNCSGAFLLGEAKLLDGRRATTYVGGERDLAAKYPKASVVVDQAVVVDGNLVTSNGSLISYTAAIELLKQMTSAAFAEKIAAGLYYDRLIKGPQVRANTTTTKATPLLTKELADIPGKEVAMMLVEYPAGASSPPHRHDAHVFVYVLEGAMTMQVDGQPPVTLNPGETFYENPKDIHRTSANASASDPARFLVVMVKDRGKQTSRPVALNP